MESFQSSSEDLAILIEKELLDSLEMLRSKIGTIVISGQDKYEAALEKLIAEQAHLTERASTEHLSMDELQTECDALKNRAIVFDKKMQELSRDY